MRIIELASRAMTTHVDMAQNAYSAAISPVVTGDSADARISSSPNFADAMAELESALSAGVPIADLLAMQARRI